MKYHPAKIANFLIERYNIREPVITTVAYKNNDFPEPEFKDDIIFEMWYRFDIDTIEIHNIVLNDEYRGQGFFKTFIIELKKVFKTIKIFAVVNTNLANYLRTIGTQYHQNDFIL